MVSLGLPGGFTEPFSKGVAISLVDRRLVRFLRRKSFTAQCILHVVEQHIGTEPGRVNREDFATDDKCQLSSVSLAASVFQGPKMCTPYFHLQTLVVADRRLNQGLIHAAPH